MKRPRPRFEFEVEVLRGEEGQELRLEQGRVIEDLLMWVQTHRSHPSTELNRRDVTRPDCRLDLQLDRSVLHRCAMYPGGAPGGIRTRRERVRRSVSRGVLVIRGAFELPRSPWAR